MKRKSNPWAVLLAGGEGKRLKGLTTSIGGVSIPKQFCSLDGELSLLEKAVRRARSVVTLSRLTAVVTEQHEEFWSRKLAMLARHNCLAEPNGKGTGNGILLSLLHILNRDPDASVVILPSDHYVSDEKRLRNSVRSALKQVRNGVSRIVLLGIRPDRPDPELGYILPGRVNDNGACSVLHFAEKPSIEQAARLVNIGALWNSFIIVGSGQSLLDLFATRFPEVVCAMIKAMTVDADLREPALHRLYSELPDIDFCRHVLAGAEEQLHVLPVPQCGWRDLGTPERVSEALARSTPRRPNERTPAVPGFNVSAAYRELSAAV